MCTPAVIVACSLLWGFGPLSGWVPGRTAPAPPDSCASARAGLFAKGPSLSVRPAQATPSSRDDSGYDNDFECMRLETVDFSELYPVNVEWFEQRDMPNAHHGARNADSDLVRGLGDCANAFDHLGSSYASTYTNLYPCALSATWSS